MSTLADLARKLDRIESRQAINDLPCRYALAVDSRDIDTWLGLFIDDVDCGRRGKGREALRSYIEPAVRTFYRSIHQICGHVVDFIDDDTATGTVYCRAEHEDGDAWVVMTIIYFDRYVRRDGQWFFERRQEKHWYTADVLERPSPVFAAGGRWANLAAHLPGDFPTWKPFWDSMEPDELAELTDQPCN